MIDCAISTRIFAMIVLVLAPSFYCDEVVSMMAGAIECSCNKTSVVESGFRKSLQRAGRIFALSGASNNLFDGRCYGGVQLPRAGNLKANFNACTKTLVDGMPGRTANFNDDQSIAIALASIDDVTSTSSTSTTTSPLSEIYFKKNDVCYLSKKSKSGWGTLPNKNVNCDLIGQSFVLCEYSADQSQCPTTTTTTASTTTTALTTTSTPTSTTTSSTITPMTTTTTTTEATTTTTTTLPTTLTTTLKSTSTVPESTTTTIITTQTSTISTTEPSNFVPDEGNIDNNAAAQTEIAMSQSDESMINATSGAQLAELILSGSGSGSGHSKFCEHLAASTMAVLGCGIAIGAAAIIIVGAIVLVAVFYSKRARNKKRSLLRSVVEMDEVIVTGSSGDEATIMTGNACHLSSGSQCSVPSRETPTPLHFHRNVHLGLPPLLPPRLPPSRMRPSMSSNSSSCSHHNNNNNNNNISGNNTTGRPHHLRNSACSVASSSNNNEETQPFIKLVGDEYYEILPDSDTERCQSSQSNCSRPNSILNRVTADEEDAYETIVVADQHNSNNNQVGNNNTQSNNLENEYTSI